MFALESCEVYPASALVKKQPEVKAAARERIVRITEHGRAAYVFASEEVFRREVEEAVAEALEAIEMRAVILRGREDYAAGRYLVGIGPARAEVARRRMR